MLPSSYMASKSTASISACVWGQPYLGDCWEDATNDAPYVVATICLTRTASNKGRAQLLLLPGSAEAQPQLQVQLSTPKGV